MVQIFERAAWYCYQTILQIISLRNGRWYTTLPAPRSCLAGWLSRHQQVAIDYLVNENRVLKDQLVGVRQATSGTFLCRIASTPAIIINSVPVADSPSGISCQKNQP